ncbi:hypothetical protein K4749_08330 [Streptomyces sp. TRM72054]|uniref:MFS transporter n=1 Tax=Streptomyces sp. TRM72054 TaxID=2870562 RepID=UPI0035ABDA89|nr:hypothetical protein [Streptomyces sp. TRM72054]
MQSSGSGLFLTSNAIFLTRYAGLSPFQVGLGLAVAGLLGFTATVPLGRLADRIGAQPLLVAGYGTLAVLFVSYCFVGNFAAFVVVASLISICETSGSPHCADRGTVAPAQVKSRCKAPYGCIQVPWALDDCAAVTADHRSRIRLCWRYPSGSS